MKESFAELLDGKKTVALGGHVRDTGYHVSMLHRDYHR